MLSKKYECILILDCSRPLNQNGNPESIRHRSAKENYDRKGNVIGIQSTSFDFTRNDVDDRQQHTFK
jgi:hypothetical protein